MGESPPDAPVGVAEHDEAIAHGGEAEYDPQGVVPQVALESKV